MLCSTQLVTRLQYAESEMDVVYDKANSELQVSGDTMAINSCWFKFRSHGYEYEHDRWVLQNPTKLDFEELKSLQHELPSNSKVTFYVLGNDNSQ